MKHTQSQDSRAFVLRRSKQSSSDVDGNLGDGDSESSSDNDEYSKHEDEDEDSMGCYRPATLAGIQEGGQALGLDLQGVSRQDSGCSAHALDHSTT